MASEIYFVVVLSGMSRFFLVQRIVHQKARVEASGKIGSKTIPFQILRNICFSMMALYAHMSTSIDRKLGNIRVSLIQFGPSPM
jgi:hypothetical protein